MSEYSDRVKAEGAAFDAKMQGYRDDPSRIFGCPPLYALWSATIDGEDNHDERRRITRRLGGWKLIARAKAIVAHEETTIEDADRAWARHEEWCIEHGEPDPDWLARYRPIVVAALDERMAHERAYRHLNEGWNGTGFRPSQLACIAEFVIATGSHPERAIEYRQTHSKLATSRSQHEGASS